MKKVLILVISVLFLLLAWAPLLHINLVQKARATMYGNIEEEAKIYYIERKSSPQSITVNGRDIILRTVFTGDNTYDLSGITEIGMEGKTIGVVTARPEAKKFPLAVVADFDQDGLDEIFFMNFKGENNFNLLDFAHNNNTISFSLNSMDQGSPLYSYITAHFGYFAGLADTVERAIYVIIGAGLSLLYLLVLIIGGIITLVRKRNK